MSQSHLGPNQPTEPPSSLQTLPARNVEHISIYIHRSPADVYAYLPTRKTFLCGLLDHDVELESGMVVHNPMRVVPNGEGSEFMFTLIDHYWVR